jgi:RNA polymerase sigma factor (sigma-70 family)
MTRLDRLTDAELLARTARDGEAFAAFYRRHERLVFRYLISRTRDAELATDLAAETFAWLLEIADRFDPERAGGSSATAWVLAIARNVLRESIRRGAVAEEARRRLELEPLELDDGDLERVGALDDDATLEALLAELHPEQRRVVIARVLDEREYEEIASQLGCSQLVVRKRVSRGLSRLRSVFAPLTPDPGR